jgi:hypothetical protein
MGYSISVSEDRTFVIQKMWGPITIAKALASATESHALGKKLGINHYLVDAVEAQNVENPVANYEFANHQIDPSKINRNACVALLVHPDDKSHDFVQTVLRNAGHWVTLFRDRKAALAHLRFHQPKPGPEPIQEARIQAVPLTSPAMP